MQHFGDAPHAPFRRSGAVLIVDRRTLIDCVIHELSPDAASIELQGDGVVPESLELLIDGEDAVRHCRVTSREGNSLKLGFHLRQHRAPHPSSVPVVPGSQTAGPTKQEGAPEYIRTELLSLRAALNEVPFGVVLLDAEMRAQFINRAFRKTWRLTDAKADSRPAFISLMYHGRDTRAYDIPDHELKDYIAERVALVRKGDKSPLHLRLKNGEILRFQCTPLPNGGRMLCYTYVTDIVKHADELEALRIALDSVQQGITLLDANLNVQFMNLPVRQLWSLSNEFVARRPHYREVMGTARLSRPVEISADELEAYIAERISSAQRGDPTPKDIQLTDGRFIRSQCAVLPAGGRMLTYTDVSDLVRSAADMQYFATTDAMTDLVNRRHFFTLAEAEWQRFQRYYRPLSLLIFDIDNFKFINDNFGHEAGDRAIVHLAKIAKLNKRPSDTLARIGGDEFVLLLPETDTQQAAAVAERLREELSRSFPEDIRMKITISVGVASATASMADVRVLVKKADEALYNAKAKGRNRVCCSPIEAQFQSELAAE